VFRFYEAAVRDLQQPAISCPWQLHPNLLCQAEPNGWFSAIRLIVKISGPGQLRPFAIPAAQPFMSPVDI